VCIRVYRSRCHGEKKLVKFLLGPWQTVNIQFCTSTRAVDINRPFGMAAEAAKEPPGQGAEEQLGSSLIVNGGPDAALWNMPW
jgi:hypothetical protein